MSANDNVRLEAFADGVFAIALTLLIIEVRVPPPTGIGTTAELWHALQHVLPTVFAFILSFAVIFITWVNHRSALRLTRASSTPFIYANGLLLMTVVAIPFTAALLGEYILSDHAAPAVVLYNGVLAVQGIAWLCLNSAALKGDLGRNEDAAATFRRYRRNAVFAFTLYGLLTIGAVWFPTVVAIVTTLTWGFWLALSLRLGDS